MISGPWAPRDLEKRANAFAAKTLVAARIARRLSLWPALFMRLSFILLTILLSPLDYNP
jgi:hypothetical protein